MQIEGGQTDRRSDCTKKMTVQCNIKISRHCSNTWPHVQMNSLYLVDRHILVSSNDNSTRFISFKLHPELTLTCLGSKKQII